jgi:hypothetical protein
MIRALLLATTLLTPLPLLAADLLPSGGDDTQAINNALATTHAVTLGRGPGTLAASPLAMPPSSEATGLPLPSSKPRPAPAH